MCIVHLKFFCEELQFQENIIFLQYFERKYVFISLFRQRKTPYSLQEIKTMQYFIQRNILNLYHQLFNCDQEQLGKKNVGQYENIFFSLLASEKWDSYCFGKIVNYDNLLYRNNSHCGRKKKLLFVRYPSYKKLCMIYVYDIIYLFYMILYKIQNQRKARETTNPWSPPASSPPRTHRILEYVVLCALTGSDKTFLTLR